MKARSLFLNAASLVLGRMLLSFGRLGATLLVARVAGAETYGEYALVIGSVFLCEWLADFGQTDITVRDTGQFGNLGNLVQLQRLKVVTAPLAAATLPVMLFGLGYSTDMVLAGVTGTLAVLATGALQPYRAALRLEGRQHIDIGAEIAGFGLMIALLIMSLWFDLGLWALIGASSAARIVQLVLLWFLTVAHGDEQDAQPLNIWRLAQAAFPLGIIGLLVLVYELSAPIILSYSVGFADVGLFMAAFRLVAPTVIVSQAISQAFFPVLSAAWGTQSVDLIAGQNAVVLLCALSSSIMAAAAFGGADALMGLFGSEFLPAADILRVLSIVVFLRAMTTAMSPLIIIADRQSLALWLTVTAVVLQLVLLVVLVPRFGLIGAALGYLAVELVVSTFAVWLFAVKVSGVQPNWTVPLRVAIGLGVAAAGVAWIGVSGNWIGFFVAPSILLATMGLLGVLTPQRARTVAEILSRRASVDV